MGILSLFGLFKLQASKGTALSLAGPPRFDLASDAAYGFCADGILMVGVAAMTIFDTRMLQNKDLKMALCLRSGIF